MKFDIGIGDLRTKGCSRDEEERTMNPFVNSLAPDGSVMPKWTGKAQNIPLPRGAYKKESFELT